MPQALFWRFETTRLERFAVEWEPKFLERQSIDRMAEPRAKREKKVVERLTTAEEKTKEELVIPEVPSREDAPAAPAGLSCSVRAGGWIKVGGH